MLYQLLYPLKNYIFAFNVFRYITFRSALAALTALIISFVVGPYLIRFLQKISFGQVIRTDGPASHHGKKGTPTMGGLLILLSVTVSILLWGRLDNIKVVLLLATLLILGVVGFLDDYLKIKFKNSKGISGWYKLAVQAAVGLGIGSFLFFFDHSTYIIIMKFNELTKMSEIAQAANVPSTTLFVPFVSGWQVNLKLLYFPFAMIIVMGSSNAVNLTDGLDGLAIGLMIFMALAYSVFAYAAGNEKVAAYLLIPHIRDAGEMTVFTASLVGAGLGFLWFNAHPAELFMGDVGSLALGGVLGVIAIFLKQELLLLIVGGVYVAELVSVVIQRVYFKYTKLRYGKGVRVFLMAPVHHHFELKGWHESKVVIRFWIIGALLVLVGIATLKIR